MRKDVFGCIALLYSIVFDPRLVWCDPLSFRGAFRRVLARFCSELDECKSCILCPHALEVHCMISLEHAISACLIQESWGM